MIGIYTVCPVSDLYIFFISAQDLNLEEFEKSH